MTSRYTNQEPAKQSWLQPFLIAISSGLISQFVLYKLGAAIHFQIMFALGYVLILVAGSRTFGFVFVYRVMLPLSIAITAVYCYRLAYEQAMVADFLAASKNNFAYLELLFDILATLYAICTAFLLWKGLTDHDNLRKLLSNEANNMERLLGYLHYFSFDNTTNLSAASIIRKQLKDYIRNVLDGNKIVVNKKNSEVLRECGRQISLLEPDDANDQVALAETMKALSDLTSARSQRISQMEIGMSPYILMALAVMSLGVLYPFFTEPPASDNIREVCIFLLSGVLSFLLITLLDISHPFNGYWRIKTDAFKTIDGLIDDEIQEAEEFRRSQRFTAKSDMEKTDLTSGAVDNQPYGSQ